jgi:dextranase
MSPEFSELRSSYLLGEDLVLDQLPADSHQLIVRTAFGATIDATLMAQRAFLSDLPIGTHALEARDAANELIAEEFFTVRRHAGEDPVMAFVTSFGEDRRDAVLSWLGALRCTVVQVYDWMNTYSWPLATEDKYRDPLGRPIDRAALEALIAGIRQLGAVAQAYAPVLAAGDDLAKEHPEWRLLRNDGKPESLGDLLQIMDPGNVEWQHHWIDEYGQAADALGFDGFHLDTYGYPRNAVSEEGASVSLEAGFDSFVRAVRDARPEDVMSFNQVNGVPRGFNPPASPSFRYVEVWPPNDKWRHLEGLLTRSAGDGAFHGDTLAIYPSVWDGDREAALRTAVLSEAVVTVLGANTLIWGDVDGVLCHPYYVNHETLNERERATVLEWHRFALRCRDLFKSATDTSWYELADENASILVEWDGAAFPEPAGNGLFARCRRSGTSVVVSLIDLTGSVDGSWMAGTAVGQCEEALVSVLVDEPAKWRADIAVLGRDEGRFVNLDTEVAIMREGNALSVHVPLGLGWSVLRLSARSDR